MEGESACVSAWPEGLPLFAVVVPVSGNVGLGGPVFTNTHPHIAHCISAPRRECCFSVSIEELII